MERWDYTQLKPGDLNAATENCIKKAQDILEGVLEFEGKRTVENTLEPLNDLGILLSNTVLRIAMLRNLSPRKHIRTTAGKCIQEISDFSARFNLNPGLYKAVRSVDVSRADRNTKRLLEYMLRDFRRYGTDKDEATREKILELHMEITRLSMEYSRRDAETVHTIEVGPEELSGVPQDVASRLGSTKEGKKIVSTNYSDYFAVMQFCSNPDVRKRLAVAAHTRALENEDTLREVLQKRRELVRMLGYENWADYAAEVMMSGSAKNVQEFIGVLDAATKTPAAKESDILLEIMREDDIDNGYLANYDRLYYIERAKSIHSDYNPQEFMQYFPYERVKEGILDVYSELFNVTFVPNVDMSVWHHTVDCYDVIENGELLGRIYLDMHPRSGKYNHAACGTLVPGIKGRQVPESFLMCNFPGGKKSDGAALMQFGQVETFFHEFGHLLHAIFAGSHRWLEFTGISTEHDFVETPSQLLEEWLFDPEVLQRIGRHYELNEPIPEEFVEKLRIAEGFGRGLHVRRQMFLSAVSFYLHTNPNPQDLDFASLWKELEEKYSPFVHEDGTHQWTTWGHLIGYSSNYYTYMWSLAIAKDLMTGFDPDNLMNKNIARKYRKRVLEPGGSRDAADMVEDFLGRPHNFEAFEQWLNS